VFLSNTLYDSLKREAENRNCSTREFHEKLVQEALWLLTEVSLDSNANANANAHVQAQDERQNLSIVKLNRSSEDRSSEDSGVSKNDLMTNPVYIDVLRQKVEKILNPVTDAVRSGTKAEKNFLFTADRSDAGRELPPGNLIYFLFVRLLGYTNLGKYESISWSIPIDYNGTAFLLERRNQGTGLFFSKKYSTESDCREIVAKITSAVKITRPFYECISQDMRQS